MKRQFVWNNRRLVFLTGSILAISLAAGAADQKPAGPDKPNKPEPPEVKYKAELTTQAIQDRIQKCRTADITLIVIGPDGKPWPDFPVRVRQVRHKFLFGCAIFGLKVANAGEIQKAYQTRFTDLLNFATIPFYWGEFEWTEGQPATQRRTAVAQWCREHGIVAKGHPLCWQQGAPRWLAGKDSNEVLQLQLGRITRDVKQFAGLIDTWDVVNEAVVMPTFDANNPICIMGNKLTPPVLIADCFATARAANPAATLILNDYDAGPKYEKLIADCLQAGVKIDAIGIQCHQHTGVWGAARAYAICERFGRFGRPLHFTEATIHSGEMKKNMKWGGHYDDWKTTPEGEQRQAQQVAEFYTILFSHPAVEAITWWDFSDRDAWLGAPSGLVREDMSPKPAYEALMKLVKKDWWTGEQKLTTDAQGRVKFHGFLGTYAVHTSDGGGDFEFKVDKAGSAEATMSFVLQKVAPEGKLDLGKP